MFRPLNLGTGSSDARAQTKRAAEGAWRTSTRSVLGDEWTGKGLRRIRRFEDNWAVIEMEGPSWSDLWGYELRAFIVCGNLARLCGQGDRDGPPRRNSVVHASLRSVEFGIELHAVPHVADDGARLSVPWEIVLSTNAVAPWMTQELSAIAAEVASLSKDEAICRWLVANASDRDVVGWRYAAMLCKSVGGSEESLGPILEREAVAAAILDGYLAREGFPPAARDNAHNVEDWSSVRFRQHLNSLPAVPRRGGSPPEAGDAGP